MADNSSRSYRMRDPVARGGIDPTARDVAGDPLAELARLIGQTDPTGETGRDGRHDPAEIPDDTASAAAGLDWAANDGYAEQDRAEDRYVPPPLAASYPPYSSNSTYSPPDADYADEPPVATPYPAPAPTLGRGVREPSRDYAVARDDRAPDDPAPLSRSREAPPLAPQSHDNRYDTSDQHQGGADHQSDASDEYYDEVPYRTRRSGTIVVIAALSLAVLGAAGAFGYRAMFGGSVLPALPPIIKAGDSPIKIVPTGGASQASNAGQGAAGAGSSEKLVPREEQPVEIKEPANVPAPRVVSTIPVAPSPNSSAPGSGAPGASALPAPAVGAAAPAPNSSAPALASPEPKKIHTVTIRPDQPGADGGAAAPPPRSTASRSPAPPRPIAASPPPAGANAPLALVPAQGDAPPPPPARTHTASARAVAPSPAAGSATAPVAAGGYAVQVTSQRSEADAEASFQSLQAKYPSQLGGRHPILRRADLGAKGVFYRALVGPFASMEQAAGVCSSLKAAGGSCVVQKN